MAITVNGKKVAGIGPAGLSPYQVAKAGGYTGTEQEFNKALAGIENYIPKVLTEDMYGTELPSTPGPKGTIFFLLSQE